MHRLIWPRPTYTIAQTLCTWNGPGLHPQLPIIYVRETLSASALDLLKVDPQQLTAGGANAPARFGPPRLPAPTPHGPHTTPPTAPSTTPSTTTPTAPHTTPPSTPSTTPSTRSHGTTHHTLHHAQRSPQGWHYVSQDSRTEKIQGADKKMEPGPQTNIAEL